MSAKIDVNITESRTANTRLVPIRKRIDGVSDNLLHLLSTVDSKILSQNNLKARIYNTRKSTLSIEADIRNMHTSITSMLSRYEEADILLLSKIPADGLTRS